MRDLLAMARFLVDRWANGDICIAVPADVSHWYSYWDRQDASLVLVWFIRSLSGWCWIGCVQLMSSSSSSRIKRASLPSLSVTICFSSPADWRRGLRLTTYDLRLARPTTTALTEARTRQASASKLHHSRARCICSFLGFLEVDDLVLGQFSLQPSAGREMSSSYSYGVKA